MKKHLCKVVLSLAIATPAMAEFDGAGVYWPLPKNTNVISMTNFDGRANFSFTALERYRGTLDVAPDIWMLSHVRSQPLFGRTIHWSALLPFGSIDTDSSLPVGATNTFASGVGDLQFGGTVNVIGAPELAVRDYLRFDTPVTVGIGFHVTAPTGTYDASEALNMGSNRWNARLSMPVVWQLGDWVPGRRTTLEVMPSVRFFGDNSDSLGDTVSQDPVYSLEAHLTKDVTKNAFLSFDYTYLNGGDQMITDNTTAAMTSISGIDAHFAGITFGLRCDGQPTRQLLDPFRAVSNLSRTTAAEAMHIQMIL